MGSDPCDEKRLRAKRVRPLLIFFSSFHLCTSPLLAEEPSASLPKEAMELQAKAAAVKSYQAKFILQAQEEGGEQVRLTGSILFQGPNQRRVELKEEGSQEIGQLLVSDGSEEWQYLKEANTVYRVKNPPQAPGPHRAFAEVKANTLRFVGDRPLGSESVYRFEGSPVAEVTEGAPVAIQTIRVDVGKADGLVRELTLLDAQGKEILSQRYQEVQVDVPVAQGTFSFAPPAGVQVIDLDEGRAPEAQPTP